jgi:hypothetical protein
MMNAGGEFNKMMGDAWFGSYNSITDNFSKEEHNRLDNYRDMAYSLVNKIERGDVSGVSDENIKKSKEISESVSKSISKSEIKQDIVAYRGIKPSGEVANFFKGLKVGDEYSDSAFISTSIDKSVADKFSEGGVNLKILIPKGSKGLPMQNVGSETSKDVYSNEYEVLLDKGSNFRVVSKENNQITVALV